MIKGPITFKKKMLDAKHEYELDMERAGLAARDRPSARTPDRRWPSPVAGAAGSTAGRRSVATAADDLDDDEGRSTPS